MKFLFSLALLCIASSCLILPVSNAAYAADAVALAVEGAEEGDARFRSSSPPQEGRHLDKPRIVNSRSPPEEGYDADVSLTSEYP